MIFPLELQKFHITDLLLLIQHKQLLSKLNKQQFGAIIINTYGKSLRSNFCSVGSAQRGNSAFVFYLSSYDHF